MTWLKRLLRPKPRTRNERPSELDELKALLRELEGVRLKAYPDSAGVWTVGVGATRFLGGTPISKGWKISQEQCDALLDRDAKAAHTAACKLLRDDATRGARIGWSAFIFNLGETRARNSKALREFNRGDMEAFAKEFLEWRMAGGKVVRGLEKRRRRELEIILEGEKP